MSTQVSWPVGMSTCRHLSRYVEDFLVPGSLHDSCLGVLSLSCGWCDSCVNGVWDFFRGSHGS